jgi:ech hydrogenase subunit F
MSDFLKMSKTVIEWVCKKPFCKMYPVVPGKVYDKTRGCVMNDASKCTLCTLCDKKCPTGAIKVDRTGGTWEINHFQCIMCNECVTNCRPGSLTMENKHAAPAAKKEVLSMKVELKKPTQKPATKAEKTKASENLETKTKTKPASKAEKKPEQTKTKKVKSNNKT